jgi:hypothetical protein
MIGVTIFNRLSGRYLADWETGDYLMFQSNFLANLYIKKKNLNPEHLEIRRLMKNESD